MSERDIFLNALDIEGPAARAAYLDEACAGRPELRRRIEGLLRAHPAAEEAAFLEVPALEQLAGGDQALTFLAPPREPGALGRLDHYDVLEVVGRGATGVVLKARDSKLQRVVALKVLAPRLAGNGPARERFVREAQATAAVRDDHVIAVHAVSDDGPLPYLVMEYIAGVTLEQRINKAGPLGLAEVLRIGLQVARGLAAAHAQGLIHRDIKPANILLENGVQRVKITDFGLACAAGLAERGVIAGTPRYMAPCQARGEPTGERSDLFSLGAVLYALCTGRPPFDGDTTAAVLRSVCEDTPRPIRATRPDLPEGLCDLIDKLLAKGPRDRFGSAREVADLLTGWLAREQQQPPPLSPGAAQSAPPPAELRPARADAPALKQRRRSTMSTGFPYFLAPDGRDLDELRGKAIWAIVFGALLVVLGLLAIGHPVVTTVTTAWFAGLLLLIGGVVEAASGLWARRWGGFFLHLLVGLLYIFVGAVLVERPLLSAVEYTLLLAVFFVASGLYRAVTALGQRFSGWGWSAFNGVVTFVLGVLIWRGWPDTGLWVVGTFVGIELVLSGWTWVMLGLAVRSVPAAP
jgi:serine/threonine protein kinase/uncharacterized membrane protein HdeD (DUF308 family)